jgi:hypothetical protein
VFKWNGGSAQTCGAFSTDGSLLTIALQNLRILLVDSRDLV